MDTNQRLAPHLAAEIFPAMSEDDYGKLKANIRANGLNEPIWLYQGAILDGRHRHRACAELGIPFKTREYTGDNPVGFVVSANLLRRHLNESQRAMIAAKLADTKRGGDRVKAQTCALTHAQAAEKLNVSPRMVDKASALLNAEAAGQVDSELTERVQRGELRLARAEKIAKLPKNEQCKVAAQTRDRKVASAASSRSPKQWEREFDEMAARTERLIARVVRFRKRADKAGMATRELSRRLVEACRKAVQELAHEADRLELWSGGSDAKPTPAAEAA